jgi:hypothetical protein
VLPCLVESQQYDVVNSEVFSEICDGQMLELTRKYRAVNDVDFAEFIADLRIIKNGGKPDFKHMEQLNVENLYAEPISLERLSIINGCKKNQEVELQWTKPPKGEPSVSPTPRGCRLPLYPRGGGSSLWPQKE